MQEEEQSAIQRPRPVKIYGVVRCGKPLSRAIWTESRELAEDMLQNGGDGAAELWEATLLVST